MDSPDEEEIGNEKEMEVNSEGGGSDGEDEAPRSWMNKVELPSFEGSDPLGWIARVEIFFEVREVKTSEKLRLSFISMEGNAVHWFQFWCQESKNPTREEFTTALLRRYGGSSRRTVFEKLASLRQTGTIKEYVQEFELLVAQASNTSEDQMLGYFFAGLHQDIRGQVRPHDPQDVKMNFWVKSSRKPKNRSKTQNHATRPKIVAPTAIPHSPSISPSRSPSELCQQSASPKDEKLVG